MNFKGSASNGKITAYQVERRGRSPPITAEHLSDMQFIKLLSKNLHQTDSLHPLGSEQAKQIVFASSAEPKFVNIPQNNFVEPFVLNPGTWTVLIEAEGILLVSLRPTLVFVRCGDEVISFSASWFLLAGLSRFWFLSFCPLIRRITWSCYPAPTTKPLSCKCESPTLVLIPLEPTAAIGTQTYICACVHIYLSKSNII